MSPLNAVNDQNPRQIAARILGQRRMNGLFVEDLLEIALAGAPLSPADRGLCQEIVYGIVRWQAALDWLIARKTNGREQKPALQNLLRLGLYQIFWLDRIPDHAAVHETVELAKQSGFGPQAGFVNAVLRGYLREADETKKLLADLKISQPALGWSQPEWLVEKWQKQFGDERTQQLLEWNNTPPKTFARVNTLRFGSSRGNEALSKTEISQSLLTSAATNKTENVGDLLARWREEDVDYDFVRRDFLGRADLPVGEDAQQRVPIGFENLVFELKSHPPLHSLASFRDGWFYIQDPSTLLAVRELGAQPGETVLDLCAAPGGKTTFIAQLMNNDGRILAQDISEDRLKLIRENCARLGVTCVETILSSTFDLQPSTFNRVLVDAPCSNTGVMRRRVDLRWRITPDEIARLRQTQLDLLKLATAKLKPGGVLVYSTCSLEPEENFEVVAEFLREHQNFKLETERQLLPFADNVDGAYVARLKYST
jgi:16S rRNA (cytosine967-C5)-methyltransferase